MHLLGAEIPILEMHPKKRMKDGGQKVLQPVWCTSAEKALLVGLHFHFFLYKKDYHLSPKGFRSKMWKKLLHYPLALILDGFQPLLMVGMSPSRSFYLKTFNNLKQTKNTI